MKKLSGLFLNINLMLFLGVLSPVVAAQTQTQCYAHAAWFEARGEPVRVQAAVLQVVRNRAKKWHMKVCDVVRQKGAFSWYRKGHNFKMSQKMLTNYFDAFMMLPVVGDSYLYFNQTPLSFGHKNHKRIGKLYFS